MDRFSNLREQTQFPEEYHIHPDEARLQRAGKENDNAWDIAASNLSDFASAINSAMGATFSDENTDVDTTQQDKSNDDTTNATELPTEE